MAFFSLSRLTLDRDVLRVWAKERSQYSRKERGYTVWKGDTVRGKEATRTVEEGLQSEERELNSLKEMSYTVGKRSYTFRKRVIRLEKELYVRKNELYIGK
jgi:hypothetical protein